MHWLKKAARGKAVIFTDFTVETPPLRGFTRRAHVLDGVKHAFAWNLDTVVGEGRGRSVLSDRQDLHTPPHFYSRKGHAIAVFGILAPNLCIRA